MKKIVAFSGTQGTGKTTAAYQKATDLKIENKDKTIGVICEIASQSPFPINLKTTLDSQSWIFSKQIITELEYIKFYDIVVSDRPVFDMIAYTYAAYRREIDREVKKAWYDLYQGMILMSKAHSVYYKEIVFISPENDYTYDDGTREVDKYFRKEIHDTLNYLYFKSPISDLNLPVKMI